MTQNENPETTAGEEAIKQNTTFNADGSVSVTATVQPEPAPAPKKVEPMYVLGYPEPEDPNEFHRAVEKSHKPLLLRLGLWLTIIGYLMLILGAKPSFFGLDRSPVIGFVQTSVMILGLAMMCFGGYFCNRSFFRSNPESLTSGFGIRVVWTGLIISLFTGMADVFGIGSHPLPNVPFFGPLQSDGVVVGEAVISVGLLMLFIPSIDRLLTRVLRGRPELSEDETAANW